MATFDHVLLLKIQIREESLHVSTIVIQFFVRDHEFFPEEKKTQLTED